MYARRPWLKVRACRDVRSIRTRGYNTQEKTAIVIGGITTPVLVAAMFGVVGAVVGSFVALVSVRWPRGERFLGGRSHCVACGTTLGPLELVPIISYLVLRGRCRTCGATISPRYAAVEAGAAAIGVASALLVPGLGAAAVAALGWALLLLALLDGEHFWLPSAVTWPLAAAGLAMTAALVPAALPDHLIGAAAGYLSLAAVAGAYKALRGRVGLGGGDAKLFAASGAWLGWEALPTVLAGAAIAGLVVALLLWRRGLTTTTRLPFGIFLAAATWIVAVSSAGPFN